MKFEKTEITGGESSAHPRLAMQNKKLRTGCQVMMGQQPGHVLLDLEKKVVSES
jgi:hypothetical protein